MLGCIIGQCAGDALGFPVEGQGRAHTTEYSKQFVRSCKPPIEARGGYLYGQYTDDSQLAREFLISIVDNNGNFVPQDYAEHIASMFVPPNYKIGSLFFLFLFRSFLSSSAFFSRSYFYLYIYIYYSGLWCGY